MEFLCFLNAHFLLYLDLVCENMIATGQLEEEKRSQVKEALLRRHRHHGVRDKKTKDEKKFEKDMMRMMGQKGRRRSSMFPGVPIASPSDTSKGETERSVGEIGRSQSSSGNGGVTELSMEQSKNNWGIFVVCFSSFGLE